MSKLIPADVRKMSRSELWRVAYSEAFPRSKALQAQARIAERQERFAWAAMAVAVVSAVATAVLAVVAVGGMTSCVS